MPKLLDAIQFNDKGLVAAIAQDHQTGTVLMMAWMNKEAVEQSITKGQVVYFSRSRNKLWHKGESSGHVQNIKSMHLDCDGDAILLKVEQVGGIACHTGRNNCFYQELKDGSWHNTADVIKDPSEIYQ